MAQKLITDWEKQQEIRPLAAQFKSKYDVFALEIQVVNMKKLLGIEFYNEIITNLDSTEQKYTDILDGCDFSYGGFDYSHDGIRTFMAYLNAAEYQIRSKYTETAAGIVNKSNQDFEVISHAALKQLRVEMTEYAYTYWDMTKKFIFSSIENYPLYNECKKSSTFKPIITKIG